MSITYPSHDEMRADEGDPLPADDLDDEFDDEFEDTLRRELMQAGLIDG